MNQNQTRSMSDAAFTINRRRLLAGAMGAGLAVAAGGVLKAGAQATPPIAAAANAAIGTSTKFNLNTITNEQILTIPSAGNQMTREFAEYRPWTSIPQFRQAIGKYVGNDVVTGYERYVFVPLDPTQADAETLAQPPGIGADLAAELVKSVPFASDDAFLQALNGKVSADQLAAIPAYLASKAQPTVTWTTFNLNTITKEQILTIPGAGDQMTREFAEYRPWTSVAQFRQEIGKYVGADVVAGYERYVFVPVDVTQADEATLAQLPGVGADQAAQLVKNVPYASTDAFLKALTGQISAEQLAAIPAFLVSK